MNHGDDETMLLQCHHITSHYCRRRSFFSVNAVVVSRCRPPARCQHHSAATKLFVILQGGGKGTTETTDGREESRNIQFNPLYCISYAYVSYLYLQFYCALCTVVINHKSLIKYYTPCISYGPEDFLPFYQRCECVQDIMHSTTMTTKTMMMMMMREAERVRLFIPYSFLFLHISSLCLHFSSFLLLRLFPMQSITLLGCYNFFKVKIILLVSYYFHFFPCSFLICHYHPFGRQKSNALPPPLRKNWNWYYENGMWKENPTLLDTLVALLCWGCGDNMMTVTTTISTSVLADTWGRRETDCIMACILSLHYFLYVHK